MKKKSKLQKQKGITLIALVITIVVLLILAGVSINTLFSDNGIIKSASKSGTNFKMQAVKEQIQAIKLNWEAERIVDSSVTIQRLWEDLEKAGIIESKTDSVTLKETTTENGIKVEKYEIETKEDGYLVEIIVKTNPNGSITVEIGEMEESTNPLPRISIKGVTATSSSITVKVEIAKIEKGKATYMYKLQDTETWSAEKEVTGKEITITGLQDKKIYDVKIVAKNENGERTVIVSKRIGFVAEDYTWTQNKTQLTGTHKTTGAIVTKEVGENYDYDCGVSSYTGGWKILGAENGKLLIMSTKDIGTLKLEGKAGYNTGVTQLDNMCKPYGTNARSIKVEDINRVTGYDPNKTGDGKKYGQGQMYEYGNKVTYTSSGSTGSNGQAYNGALLYNKYEHPDGRAIGSNGVTSITETSTYYYYYADTLTENSSGTTVGIAKTTNAYKALFSEDYWLASSCAYATTGITWFSMRYVHISAYYGKVNCEYLLRSDGNNSYKPSKMVRAVVSL